MTYFDIANEEAGDGYRNEFQRAMAVSQATTPRNNATCSPKVKALLAAGRFVLLEEVPVYCHYTDALLGTDTYFVADFATAQAAYDFLNVRCPHGPLGDEDYAILPHAVGAPAPVPAVVDDCPF